MKDDNGALEVAVSIAIALCVIHRRSRRSYPNVKQDIGQCWRYCDEPSPLLDVCLCRGDASGRVSVVSGPAANRQVYSALVRGRAGSMDDLHVVLPTRAVRRICLQPFDCRPIVHTDPGRYAVRLAPGRAANVADYPGGF